MSFSVILGFNSSEKNRRDKKVTTIQSLTGVLKNNTSISTPHILIECDIATVRAANYFTISEFNRKYFITDIQSVRNGLVEISGKCDILSSAYPYIKDLYCIIRRSEHKWNLYINDGVFKVQQNPDIVTQAFPSGFVTQEFVLAVAGN